jgi:hypothetical protein
MSEPLHETLRQIAKLVDKSWHQSFRDALLEAAQKLEPPPLESDTIPVRIAVALAVGSAAFCWIDDEIDDKDAIELARSENDPCPELGYAIIKAKSTEPPLCECGLPKEKLNAGRGHGQYWGCRPCRNAKSLASYTARKLAASQTVVEEIPEPPSEPLPEKPLLPCWREHHDYWSAARRLGLRGIV